MRQAAILLLKTLLLPLLWLLFAIAMVGLIAAAAEERVRHWRDSLRKA